MVIASTAMPSYFCTDCRSIPVRQRCVQRDHADFISSCPERTAYRDTIARLAGLNVCCGPAVKDLFLSPCASSDAAFRCAFIDKLIPSALSVASDILPSAPHELTQRRFVPAALHVFCSRRAVPRRNIELRRVSSGLRGRWCLAFAEQLGRFLRAR
ncbi:hypothetical protein BC628DRAFT_489046 [Trametes gibbosa]|nr:hypothetical protein BC628DRAFT_489046 [Trametes gibbosa]